MINQAIKTDLTSWKICLGLAPAPQNILDQVEVKKVCEPEKCRKKTFHLLPKQRMKAKEFMAPMVRKGAYAVEIYTHLINSGLISDDTGNVASFSLVKLIIRDAKTELGIPKYSEATSKVVELYKKGLRVNEIRDKLGLSRHHVTNINERF